MSLRTEVQLVRETLSIELAPPMATAILFDALDRWGRGVPANSTQMLELVRGPLSTILAERFGDERRDKLIASIEERLRNVVVSAEDLDLDIDIGDVESEDTGTALIRAVPHPVAVLVVSCSEGFADLLLASIGELRVYPRTATDEAGFRKGVFTVSPMIAVVDGTEPPQIRPSAMATALRTLPDATLPVLWGAETPYGKELRIRLEQAESNTMFIEKKDGIEPFLDLVLSRYKQKSLPPPPPKTPPPKE